MTNNNEETNPEIVAKDASTAVRKRPKPGERRVQILQTLASMLRTQETQGALMAQGVEPTFASAAASSARIEKELPLMRTVAQRANIQAD